MFARYVCTTEHRRPLDVVGGRSWREACETGPLIRTPSGSDYQTLTIGLTDIDETIDGERARDY